MKCSECKQETRDDDWYIKNAIDFDVICNACHDKLRKEHVVLMTAMKNKKSYNCMRKKKYMAWVTEQLSLRKEHEKTKRFVI